MSTELAAGQLQEQYEPALANIMHGVYRPRFFAKLASLLEPLGLKIENEAEMDTLLKLGFELAEAGFEVPQEQAASVGQPQVTNKFASAYDNLHRLQYTNAELANHQRKVAAAQLAQDPTLFASAMIVDAYENAQQAAAPVSA